MPDSPHRRRSFVARLSLAVLVAHLGLGLARVPGKVWQRRAEQIEAFRREGAAHYLFRTSGLEGAEVVTWLQERVPPDAVVLWRGEGPALEFVPALIAPRLLVAADRVPAGADRYAGLPLARARLDDGRSGVVVVEGRGLHLSLDVR